ncbi:hypothetical protein [Caldisalinibacter kiritimatiensis]|uniref:Uncharacterized protein n=1 Tax=Caldisalinibacter kiritimatiensis TaxID=1304284 RepID=R1CXW8_9FIRM|nr:hypothetical protein [Caldisalinibacter kiritimatiensis]EOD01439.1 hypothetical protein L21TH_0486 [Caldisalinibacter kiritimatiensis]
MELSTKKFTKKITNIFNILKDIKKQEEEGKRIPDSIDERLKKIDEELTDMLIELEAEGS